MPSLAFTIGHATPCIRHHLRVQGNEGPLVPSPHGLPSGCSKGDKSHSHLSPKLSSGYPMKREIRAPGGRAGEWGHPGAEFRGLADPTPPSHRGWCDVIDNTPCVRDERAVRGSVADFFSEFQEPTIFARKNPPQPPPSAQKQEFSCVSRPGLFSTAQPNIHSCGFPVLLRPPASRPRSHYRHTELPVRGTHPPRAADERPQGLRVGARAGRSRCHRYHLWQFEQLHCIYCRRQGGGHC